jgi:hypothetical protein
MPKTTKPVRWTRNHAAAEFNLDAATLSKRLTAASIAPGEDGRFSTSQIVAAVFGDRASALTAKAQAEAQNWQLRNEVIRRERIPLDDVEAINEQACMAIRHIILASPLPDQTKQDIFAELRGIGAAIQKWKAEP